MLKESFEIPLNDYIWLAEWGKIYTLLSQGSRKSKHCLKECIMKYFQKLYKTISESIFCNVPDFF